MLAENLIILARRLLGRSATILSGNYLLPASNRLLSVVIFTQPLSTLTSTGRVLNTEKLRPNVKLCYRSPVVGEVDHNVLCRNNYTSGGQRIFWHKGNIFHRSTDKMPALKGKRSESFRELFLGKKKDKKDKQATNGEQPNGDVADGENEETASQDLGSPGSTTSDPATKDADSIIENGDHDEEENGETEEPEAVEEEPEPIVEEPEPEPEPEGGGVYLDTLVKKLESFAPLSLAEDWDNVGLLVEPAAASEVKRVLLTNDLTEGVLEEAVEKGSNFILSYHPPIFSPLHRLTSKSEKERIVIRAIEKGIAIYSPHTAHDAVKGGVNDWLLSAFGKLDGFPISSNNSAKKFRLEIAVKKPHKQKTALLFTAENGSLARPNAKKIEKTADHLYHFKSICDKGTLVNILSSLNEMKVERVNTQITKICPDPCGDTGLGRFARLKEAVSPLTLEEAIAKVKAHLGLEHVQLAIGKDKTLESPIESVAVCAGSGGKVLAGHSADLYLTGEMSHHEVLGAVAKGTSVILCNHSNSERGYLQDLKKRIEDWFGDDVVVHVSAVDTDPLKVV